LKSRAEKAERSLSQAQARIAEQQVLLRSIWRTLHATETRLQTHDLSADEVREQIKRLDAALKAEKGEG
jgi:septal ring factor EnvC (AmiA/AmiB activator)